MNGLSPALLPLGIFAATITLFAAGLVWSRRRDRLLAQRQANQALAQEIIEKIEPWAGNGEAAWAWYRSFPIAALGGQTAEQLVAQPQGRGAGLPGSLGSRRIRMTLGRCLGATVRS